MEKMNKLWNSVIKNDNSLIKNFAFTNINSLFFFTKRIWVQIYLFCYCNYQSIHKQNTKSDLLKKKSWRE